MWGSIQTDAWLGSGFKNCNITAMSLPVSNLTQFFFCFVFQINFCIVFPFFFCIFFVSRVSKKKKKQSQKMETKRMNNDRFINFKFFHDVSCTSFGNCKYKNQSANHKSDIKYECNRPIVQFKLYSHFRLKFTDLFSPKKVPYSTFK